MVRGTNIVFRFLLYNLCLCGVVRVTIACRLIKDQTKITALCSDLGYTNVPTDLPDNLTYWYLDNNKLTSIRNGELNRYTYLDYLSINNNNISVLELDCFNGLHFLRYLFLSGNKLDILSYPKDIFKPLLNLTFLDISNNMEQTTVMPVKYPMSLVKLMNLRELHIDLMSTPVFDERYKELINLQSLTFENCFISHLTNETFKPLPGSITELVMQHCKPFVRVEADALRHFPKLQVLDLSNSRIHLIGALKLLYPLQNKTMKTIILHKVTYWENTEYDYSVVLNKEMMQYLSTICVETLDISDNNIVAIQDQSILSFQHPQCFKNLIMSANRFGIIQFAMDFIKFLQRMTNLLLFDFSYLPLEFKYPAFLSARKLSSENIIQMRNRVEAKPIITLTLPKQLIRMRLTHIMASNHVEIVRMINSSLESLDVSFYDSRIFPCFEIYGKNNLIRLDLSGIAAEMTIGKFPTLEKLYYLKMTYSKLYRMIDKNSTIFKWTPNLTFLDLSQNFIWYLNFQTLENLNKLKDLNLSHNMFKTFPDVIRSYKSIRKVDLSFNLLTTLETKTRNWVDNQLISKHSDPKIYLAGNPFVCSCETAEFISWLFKTPVKLDNNGNYSCRSPNGALNYTANINMDYHRYFSNCESTMWLKISTSFLVTVLVLIGGITVTYNCRWTIIFFLSRKFRKFVEKRLNINFEYDVYVSYHDDHASFVKRQLQPILEREWNLKICCKDRDFLLGQAKVDAIMKSINKSRNIIFLVTPSSKDDDWVKFEIDRAKYEKFTKNLQNVIVIVKDISSRDITTQLAEISKDIYIIEWLDSVWKRLRLCLQLIVLDEH